MCRWGRLGVHKRVHRQAHHQACTGPQSALFIGLLEFSLRSVCLLPFLAGGLLQSFIIPWGKADHCEVFFTFLIFYHANFLFFCNSPWFWSICDWTALNLSAGSSCVGCLCYTAVFLHPPVSTQTQWPSGRPNFFSLMLLYSFFWEPHEAIQLSWFYASESANLYLSPPEAHNLPPTGSLPVGLPQLPTFAAWQKCCGLVMAASRLCENASVSDHVSPRWVEFSSTFGAVVSFGSTWLGLDIWSNLIWVFP